MKKSILLLFLIIGLSAYSQDPFLQETNPRAREQAIEITNQYIPELSLTGKQQLLFQQKVEEYLIRRNNVEANTSGKEKLKLFYDLQQQETADMNDILTRPQLEIYKKIKPELQPLEEVEKNDD